MKKSSMKKVVVLFLAVVMLGSILCFPASADDRYAFYHASRHGHFESYANVALVIDTSDLAVVVRFYDDGSTAVYFAGHSAAEALKCKEDGEKVEMSFRDIHPGYLRAALEAGYAKLDIRSTYGPFSESQLKAKEQAFYSALKDYPFELVYSDPPASDNSYFQLKVPIPVLNYDDVPEGTTLTLVQTNYVDPEIKAAQKAEKERKAALIEEAKDADLIIDLGRLSPKERYNYSLSYFRLGFDYGNKTIVLLDEDLNEIPVLSTREYNRGLAYEGFYFYPMRDDIFVRAFRNGYVNVILNYSGWPEDVVEYAPVECINISDESFDFDELNLYEHPEVDAVVESYFPMTLEGARIVVNYLNVGADHDVCELLIQRADGKVLYKDGNAFNNGILYGIFPVKDGKIDDCMENMNTLVAKGVKEGHLTVLLRLPQKYGRYSSSGEYYGVELMEVPVIAIGAKPIELGQSATAQLDSQPLESSKSVENIALRGDVDGNGVLNAKDIVWVMKAIVGYELTGDLSLADFNGDGKLNNRDVIDMMYAAVGK